MIPVEPAQSMAVPALILRGTEKPKSSRFSSPGRSGGTIGQKHRQTPRETWRPTGTAAAQWKPALGLPTECVPSRPFFKYGTAGRFEAPGAPSKSQTPALKDRRGSKPTTTAAPVHPRQGMTNETPWS
jgi:hypothetical protein